MGGHSGFDRRSQLSFPFAFEGPIDARDGYSIIWLPADLARELDARGRLRARGTVGGVPFFGAWQPSGGRWFLHVSKDKLKRAGYREGALLSVRFRLEDEATVDLPLELADALEHDSHARGLWEARTPGWRRGRAHMISTAKQPQTRARRVAELLAELSSASARPRSDRRS